MAKPAPTSPSSGDRSSTVTLPPGPRKRDGRGQAGDSGSDDDCRASRLVLLSVAVQPDCARRPTRCPWDGCGPSISKTEVGGL
jgi:hypothetical protein